MPADLLDAGGFLSVTFTRETPGLAASTITWELCRGATSYALVGPPSLEMQGVRLRNLFHYVLQLFLMHAEM